MICPKCGKDIDTGSMFCVNCGERIDKFPNSEKLKMRKEYKTSVFILLGIFAYGIFLGTNDFYAGYIKVGIIRFVSTVFGFILGIATSNPLFLFFPGISCLVGFIELFAAPEKAYASENGVILIHPLDLIYDREGTNNYLKAKYGYCFPEKTRKESIHLCLLYYYCL